MPSLRLTRRVIDELPHPKVGQTYYRDTALPGFGLRVGARSKMFFVEGQVHGRTRRVTIGRADVFAPEVARKRALSLLGEMAEGNDPNEQKRKERTDRVTMAAAFERFFEARTNLSPHTVSSYQRTARLYLKGLNHHQPNRQAAGRPAYGVGHLRPCSVPWETSTPPTPWPVAPAWGGRVPAHSRTSRVSRSTHP
ncbi:MAG: integrase arm-type DNA-binding domain-containing protein [Rhodobacteraceae bacterium]|nr:integrase arm-type DNA-binding domain-containing protein [Paracoccaceae bacterium]